MAKAEVIGNGVLGQSLHILIGGVAGYNSVTVETVHATVVQETAKAVKLLAINERGNEVKGGIWLPKKALQKKVTKLYDGTEYERFELAHWFRADPYQASYLNRSVQIAGISVPV